MKKKQKDPYKTYIKTFVISGVVTTFFLLILYFVIWKVDEDPFIVTLYSFLPLFVYSLLALFVLIARKK
ncbi:hypothetical protein MTQ92_06860 [Staphylococcus agnetis]|uniref:hypothetical protein n=1 Tax=Staphylococcus agnetis TaxID=985762 RepID=UPI00208E3330|nr:hypothetical protein [Staphylococcus agnetis]MCO4338803.1 hypothetical protein [Staphylococcus agnetis]